MKMQRPPLLLEQLEDRIFLDANPIVAVNVDAPDTDPADTSPPVDITFPVSSQPGEQALETSTAVNDVETQEAESDENVPDSASEEQVETDAVEVISVDSAQETEQLPESSETENADIELIDPMIGEDFSFTYSFENDLPQTGYGPYVDIYFPTSGEDGSPNPGVPGSDPYDGIEFVSATYLGTPVVAVEQTFDATGQIEHAFAKDSNGDPVIITGTPGDTYVSLQLPFGSYTPQQPAAEIVITAHMSDIAQVDVPLNVMISSGFMFGADPVDNPGTDPSLANQVEQTTAWLPEVIRFEKDYVGPENETATGPNYPRSYSITVDVADGQSVNNLQIIDTLPADIVYIPGSVSATGGVTATASLTPGGVLIINLSNNADLISFIGSSGTDTTVTFDFYVGDILPGCSTSVDIINDMQLEADWDPLDDRDPFVHLVVDAEVYPDGSISTTPAADEVIEAQPIVVQKNAVNISAATNSPGDIIEYTLEFQISDYHALGNIEFQDFMSDGIAFFTDATHAPRFAIHDQYGNYVDDFLVGTDLVITPRPDLGDDTQVDFHVSQAIINAGDGDGILEGGRTNGSSGAAARGTITYYGQISEHYTTPNVPVDQGDTLSNSVHVSVERFTYDVNDNLISTGCQMVNADGSTADIEMPVGGVTKEIYAVDGVLVGGVTNIHVSPGSTVTYRLTYELPTSDFNSLVFNDYLPLPIFNAADPDHDPSTPNTWQTHFTAGDISAVPPAVGHIKFGPADSGTAPDFFSYSGLTPTVTVDGGQNTLILEWGSHYNSLHTPTYVDILFTVEVSTEPFSDGLFLTNQVQATEDGSSHNATVSDDIVQIVLDEPELEVTKGVIAKDADSAGVFTASTGPVGFTSPGSGGFRGTGSITESGLDTISIDSDMTGIDAGDRVSFGITVRNVGHYSAYNIDIGDDMPSGFSIPPGDLNLSVTDGQGNTVTFTDRSGDFYGTAGFDFFGEGLSIVPSLAGNVDAVTNQTDNILFISYDLIAVTAVQAQQQMTNTGIVEKYTSAPDPNSTNFVPEGIKDEAFVSVTEPTLVKLLVDTEISDAGSGLTDGNNERTEAVIGERVTYTVSITLQEGTTANAVLTDHLDQGLELASIDSITVVDENGGLHTGVTSSVWGNDFINFTTQADASNTNVTYNYAANGSSSFNLNLGELVNHNADNTRSEVVVVTYTAIVVNDSANQQGVTRNNSAALSFDVPTETGPVNISTAFDSAENIRIIEPDLVVVKTVNVEGVDSGPPGQVDDQNNPDFIYGDAGDPVIYTIVVRNETGSPVTAHDVDLSDTMPVTELAGFSIASATINGTDVSGYFTLSGADNHILSTIVAFDLGVGESLEITIHASLRNTIVAGVDILNEAHVEWTSYPGTPAVSGFVNTSNIDAERTGDPTDPGGNANDYNDWDPTQITTLNPANKFIVNSEVSNESDAIDDGGLAAPVANDGVNRGREATIGETIRYRVEIELPEASFLNVHAIDTLDPGLTLVSIDLISIDANDPTEIHITNSSLLGGPYTDASHQYISYNYNPGNSGDVLTLDFGTIVNDNRDNTQTEYLVLEYTVMVTDISTNTSNATGTGTLLDNDYETSWTGMGGATATGEGDSAEVVEVIEPDLNIDKVLTSVDGPGDAGDEVTYTITVSHQENECDAFDLDISDTFDANIESLNIVSAAINGIDVSSQFSISGQDLITDHPENLDLAIGETLVLVVRGTLSNSVNAGDTIPNSANVTWTSIDGARTDYTGFASGSIETQEREYSDTDNASVITVPGPSISKDLLGTDMNDSANANNEATLGELITYRVTVDLSEGTTNSATVVDTLSAGIEFVDVLSVTGLANGSNVTSDITGGLEGNLAIAGASTGQNITFTLGNLTIDGDNNGAPPVAGNDQGKDQIIITYRAVVRDIPGNEAINSPAEIFQNEAVFNYVNDTGDQATATAAADPVTLVEPDLEIVKTVNGLADSVVLEHVDAGDTVTYEITLRHSGASGSGAYDVILVDDLPAADILFSSGAGAIQSVSDNGSAPLTVNDFWIESDTLQFAIGGNTTSNSIDMDYGRVITVTLVGVLQNAVQPGERIVNESITNWTSLPSTHPNDGQPDERGLPYTDDVYTDRDDAVIQIETPGITKTGSGTFTIGEEVTFTINVSLPEGTTEDLIVTDTLPSGLVLVGTPTYDASTSFDGTVPVPIITSSGNDIVFDFSAGSVVTNGNAGTDLNVISFTVVARVENVTGNHDGGPDLVNTTHLTYTDGNSVSQSVGYPTASVDIVEPEITTIKSVVDETGDQAPDHLGEILIYTATFTNTGNSTAYEVSALDSMDMGTGFYTGMGSVFEVLYNGVSITATSTYSYDTLMNTVSFGSSDGNSWDLAAGDTITLRYTAQVLASWFVAGNHVNVIDADWSSLDGNNPGERIYDDTPNRNPGMSQDGNQDTATASYIVPRGDGEIGDTVWFDADSSGGNVMNASDSGIQGVELDLDVVFLGIHYFATAITDASGEYFFTHLPTNVNYEVILNESTLPLGMTQTYSYADGFGMDNTTEYFLPANPNHIFLGADFSYTGSGFIGDYVWYDANSNGNQEGFESAIAGVTVTIEGDLDGDSVYEYSHSVTTDSNGLYLFDFLPFVNYNIDIDTSTLPYGLTTPTWDRDGILDSRTNVSLTSSLPDVRNADFGYVSSGRIGDFIWDDHNADGLQDGGVETGLSNIEIRLDGDLDGDRVPDFTLQTVSDGAGVYLFDNLPAAFYTITVNPGSLPAGYIQSGDPDGGLDNVSQVVLSPGNMIDYDQDFGYTRTGSIGDTVWFDANDNRGQDSGEPGLSGVTVTLVGDIDLDGIQDTLTTTTDSSGQYLFDDLPTGTYTITVSAGSLPGGMRPTYDADGIATANTTLVSLGYGEDNRTTDFGYTGTGSIGDTVWIDSNRNGMRDVGESGIGGVRVTLGADLDRNGTVDYTTSMFTDGSGGYLFDNLPSGNYTVVLDSATLPSSLGQVFDPDAVLDQRSALSLGAGENNLVQDFGFAYPYNPPNPPRPPIPPVDPIDPSVEPPVPGDVHLMYQFNDEVEFWDWKPVETYMPPLPVSPIYSGHAEPGTTVSIILYDAMGDTMGYQTVMADTGGNWLASFNGTILYDMPNSMSIGQTPSLYNESAPGLLNLRIYFNPTMVGLIFSSTQLDLQTIMANEASTIVESNYNSHNSLLKLGWNDTIDYEFFSPSINPAQLKR